MTNNIDAYITILGMAAVTYLTRISGFYISNRVSDLRPGLARTLKYIPGTIIISIIAPQIIAGGKPGLIAAAACMAASLVFSYCRHGHGCCHHIHTAAFYLYLI